MHRAGQATTSYLETAVHTDANNPSKSLIKEYATQRFVSTATAWGCQHEVDAVQDFLDDFFLSIQM